MDKLAELSHGAKVVLGAAIAFLLFSFFSWFKYIGPGADQIEAVGGDIGVTMWHGVGWIAGLLAIALIVWQAIRLANIKFEIGVTPSMVTAALAVLMLISPSSASSTSPETATSSPHVLGLALPRARGRHRRRSLDEHAGGGRGPR